MARRTGDRSLRGRRSRGASIGAASTGLALLLAVVACGEEEASPRSADEPGTPVEVRVEVSGPNGCPYRVVWQEEGGRNGASTRDRIEEGNFGAKPGVHQVGAPGTDAGAESWRLNVLVRKLEPCEGRVRATLYANEDVVSCDTSDYATSETVYVAQETPEDLAGFLERISCRVERSL